MILEFENNLPIDNDFPNKKIEGKRWYTRSQDCLMFKEGSKYPDKFELNLVFADNQADQQSVGCFTVGRYELLDSAHGFDNRRNPTCDYTKIKPITNEK